ncbi:hypothetical protein [Tautonia sociabilis]|uniref:Uncharacterized protein n=1 Tax=Tautonia sociabilis TaxID=2080755 RepID=A0A432MKT2_9BACT|nr:hypothetical protein [Tautonia sociabilis]RUL88034.1 hypothetical protein TsocGM_08810 [Tautonia sociabilis]
MRNRIVLFVLGGLVFAGSGLVLWRIFGGRGEEDRGPFRFGEPRVIQPDDPPAAPLPRPVVRVLEPAKGQKIKPEDTLIACRVELTIPDGGKMPDGMIIELQQNGINYDTCSGVPEEDRGDGRYLLKGELDRPKRPGTYVIRACTIDEDVIMPESDAEQAEIKSILTYSPFVEIEVEP